MSRLQEKRLLPTKRQETSSQIPLRKLLRRKDICLHRFLMQTNVPYSGKDKCNKGCLSGRKRSIAPRFKAGRDKLTVVLCKYCQICNQD